MTKIRKTYIVETSYKINITLDYEDDVVDISEKEEEYWKQKIFEHFNDTAEFSVGIMRAKIKHSVKDYLIWNPE